jgi:hypothetical protein
MRKIVMIMVFIVSVFGYEFVMLNSTEIDDDTIIEAINEQLNNYYYDKDGKSVVEFKEIYNKEDLLKVLEDYDFSDDKDIQKELIESHEDLEDDLDTIFNTKYFLIVTEKKDYEGRVELNITLKVDNVNYFDESYLMPILEDKEAHYINTISGIVLTYIAYKNKDFINVYQY